jgi:putative methyltransferase (TIGR04325 family)
MTPRSRRVVLLERLKAAMGRLRNAPERTYRSFAEAARAGGYDADLLTRFRVERAKLNMNAISAEHLPPGYLMLYAAAHILPGRVRVTDFGGACGEWGYALERDARRQIDYVVVENASLVRSCSADPFFAWARFVSTPPDETDVFVTSGALQYVEDPYGVLRHAFSRATTAVILARNSFSESDVFRVHTSRLGDNGFGPVVPDGFDRDARVSYPHRTVSMSRVIGLATGWRCVFDVESASGVLPYRDRVFGRDLMFLRERSSSG